MKLTNEVPSDIDIKDELNFVWKSRIKLRAECAKLWAEGDKLWAECDKLGVKGSKLWAEGSKLWAEGDKLWVKGDKLWADVVLKFVGNTTIEWSYVKTEKYNDFYRCKLGNGMIFEPTEEIE